MEMSKIFYPSHDALRFRMNFVKTIKRTYENWKEMQGVIFSGPKKTVYERHNAIWYVFKKKISLFTYYGRRWNQSLCV